MLTVLLFFLRPDLLDRIQQLNESLDELEARFVDLRASIFRRGPSCN